MKKLLPFSPFLIFLTFSLSGCNTVGAKAGSLSIIYGAVAFVSLLLLTGLVFVVHKNRFWFITLFSSVFVVNVGYTFLSVSTSLEMALQANRVAYLGSVFLPLSMLMIILNVTNTKYHKRLPVALFILSTIIFLIVASPGILPIYYKEVSFAVVDGVSTLIKAYGILHPLYLFYLLGYFTAMVYVIVRAKLKKTIENSAHAIILATAVFVNIGVWFIEQLASIDFEMLSVSYIISELFLLGVHLVIKENQRLREIVKQVEAANAYTEDDSTVSVFENPIQVEAISSERIEIFVRGLKRLTPTEKSICDAYIARVTTKEIMANLNIKESTLKYHNRNLYGKLGVKSRKEILEIHKQIKSIKSKLNDK